MRIYDFFFHTVCMNAAIEARVRSRAIWTAIPNGDGLVDLQICTHITKPDVHPGYMRLGRCKAPDPSHVLSIALPDNVRTFGTLVDNISWDEESGRICLLVSTPSEPVPTFIMIIDLL